MPRRRGEEVDWYVEMSEWLERRERRRKWIVLGICVAVPLLLMGTAAVAIKLHEHGVLSRLMRGIRRWWDPPKRPPPEAPQPVTVPTFVTVNIKFSQLDANGLVTSVTHMFAELPPEGGFTVNPDDEFTGKIALYQLRNLGTGEVYEFRDVPVRKMGSAGWVIQPDVGWVHIRDQLQARMRARLGLPSFGS